MMAVCWCSLAGTAACRTCSNNPFAETPPVRTYTVSATDPVLITGRKTNADRIRAMSDEELAKEVLCGERWFDEKEALKWLKSPVEMDE